MWMFTRHGFVSVVRAGKGPADPETGRGGWASGELGDDLMVRARRREHLEAIFAGKDVTILETFMRDYRFRVIIAPIAWATIAARLALEIDYGNFKSEAARVNGYEDGYVDALHDVWRSHAGFQDGGSYARDPSLPPLRSYANESDRPWLDSGFEDDDPTWFDPAQGELVLADRHDDDAEFVSQRHQDGGLDRHPLRHPFVRKFPHPGLPVGLP